MFYELAQTYLKLKQYTDAAQTFEKGGLYQEMIDCLVEDRKFILALIKMI